jgi:DNA-binding NtrC family response regulator
MVSGSETVLIAEDDDLVRTMISKALKVHGYSVIPAKDGEMALKLFKENHASISLMLIDHTMPKQTGREVVEKVRTVAPDIPIILTSGYGSIVGDQANTAEDNLEFIGKPYDLQELTSKIRSLIDS